MIGSAIAYHPSVPLHVQIERVLRARIQSGEWEADTPIPPEMILAQRFEVSRTTIREALGNLTKAGLIVRYRGRGSFVRATPPKPEGQSRVTNLVLGYQAEVKVIKVETVAAPSHIAEPLGVQRGTPLTRFVRLELAGGGPLAVAVNYMPESLGRRIRPRDLQHLSMLEFLRDRLRLDLGPIRQSIEAQLPDEEVAGLLEIDLTQPVLFIRLLVPDSAGKPVEICDTYYRADRYRYEVETLLPPPGQGVTGRPETGVPATVRKKPSTPGWTRP
jgi:GntR family transcriptional regulator